MTDTSRRAIIDIHCHVASALCFPPSFLEGVVDNICAKLSSQGIVPNRRTIASLYSSNLNDPLCDELVREMDEAGVRESVLVAPDFTFALRDSSATIAEIVDHHKTVVERHPNRFRVLAGVDPRWGRDGLDLFDKAINQFGFHGLKLYPPCGYTPDDRMLFPFYEICSANGLPVLLHVGATSPALSFEEARPIYVDRAAKAFPGVAFILAHGSVHYPEECAMLCMHRPNIFLDVSGFQTVDVANLQPLFRHGITHKVLFGTDWPIFRLQGTQRDFVDRLTTESGAFPPLMSERDKELFFQGNAARLLGQARPSRVGCA